MDRRLQSAAPSLGARLSHPRRIRGSLHRNGRPAPQSRPAAPIARCSAGALAPISTRDSSPDWMNAGGHSNLMIPAEVIVTKEMPLLGSGKLDLAGVKRLVDE